MRFLSIILTKLVVSDTIKCESLLCRKEVAVLTSVLYEFDTIVHGENKNNIFQFVKDRKLTNVYHSHDFYELICFLQGRGTQIVNDEDRRKNGHAFMPG